MTKPNARLKKEFEDSVKAGWEVECSDDLREWSIVFHGPQASGSPYEDGSWLVKTTLPVEYPFKPPSSIFFISKIFHPNISEAGEVCMGTINDDWSPKKTMLNCVIPYVVSILGAPDLNNPMNSDAATMMKNTPKKFAKKVQDQIARMKS